MKSILKKVISMTLTLSMLAPLAVSAAAAAEYDPMTDAELRTPETLSEGNYFFIREKTFTVSEKSGDALYIPVQRTGDLSGEAEVTVKLVDMTSRFGENYTAEIYGGNEKPEDEYGGDSIIDAILENPDGIEEVYDTSDDVSLEGAVMTDADGAPIGVVSSADAENGEIVLDVPENGGEDNGQAADYPANRLRDARNHYVGTTSDRTGIEKKGAWESAVTDQMIPEGMAEKSDARLISEEYPGHTFKVHFDADETAKFLKLTPKYSSKADGDCILMVMLKDPSEDVAIHEDFCISNVSIADEDEREEVKVSITDTEIYGENGRAVVEVTREGRINDLVTVMMTTSELSAKTGDDFSGVNAKLHFPMGIKKRSIEIPVLNADEEKDFRVTITPFTDCTVENSSAHITILRKPSEDASVAAADYRTDEPLSLSGAKKNNNCWEAGGMLQMSGKGRPNDEQEYATIPMHYYRGYFYDGVLVDWAADISWFSSGWASIDGMFDDPDQPKLVFSDHEIENRSDPGSSFDETAAYFFGATPGSCHRGANPVKIWVGICTNSGRGRDLTVRSVKPILRQWEFKLNPAEKINMRGLTDDEIADLESVVINSDTSATSYTAWGNENFSISAAYKPARFRLKAIEAIVKDDKGNVIKAKRIAEPAKDSSSVIINVTEDMINQLARLDYIDFQYNKITNMTINGDDRAKGQSVKGTIEIRPVFEPIEATVVINSHDYGSFEGLTPGEQKAYYGERLSFKTKLSEKGERAGVRGVGVEYVQKTSKDGEILDNVGKNGTGKGTNDYIKDESLTYTVNAPYTIYTPTFTENDNKVVVRIKEGDLGYFDTSKGLFKGHTGGLDGTTGYYSYIVTDKINPNEVAELIAFIKNADHVPTWTQGSDSTVYSGSYFPLRAGTIASDNVVTLGVETDTSKTDTYAFSGAVYAPQVNISTGHNTETVSAVENAIVSIGDSGDLTKQKGEFALYPHKFAGGTTARYTITYNGAVNIDEMTLPAAGTKKTALTYTSPTTGKEEQLDSISVDAGMIKIPAYSQNGVHITRATVTQNEIQNRGADAIMMNGKKTVLGVRVDPGVGYIVNEEHRDENVKGVKFMFINGYTNDVHGVYDAEYDRSSDMWKYQIDEFTPDKADEFTYGDVLYAAIITDREVRGLDSSVYDMVYMPVSTGFAVATDVNYQPKIFEYEMPVDAESMADMLGGSIPGMSSEGEEDSFIAEAQKKRVTYGQFPFLGEITIMWKIMRWCQNRTMNRGIEEMLDMLGEDSDNDSFSEGVWSTVTAPWNWFANKASKTSAGSQDWTRNIVFKVKDLPYGGTRLLFGVGYATGSEGFRNRMNPYTSVRTVYDSLVETFGSGTGYYERMKSALKADAKFGGPYFAFSFVLGVYIDFGYLVITTEKENGTTERSHDIIFLGGGGCIGAKLSIGTTTPVMIAWVVPGYVGMEASADVTVYIGKSKDPNKSLEQYKSNDGVVLEKTEWKVDVYGHVNGSGIFGIGIDNALGVKLKAGAEIELGYSGKMSKWYPELKSDFGAGADFVASGTLELLGMKIPLASFSYPLPFASGFIKYFRNVRLANRTITYVQKGIDDIIERGEQARYQTAIDTCRAKIAALEHSVDTHQLILKSPTDDLRSYAYREGILSTYRYLASQCTRLGGLLSLGELTEADTDENKTGDEGFYVEPAHDSKWVANEHDAELESAFKPVSTKAIMRDAVAQPHARVMNIGDDRILVVFLMNDPSNANDPAQMLAYSVYNTNNDTWTDPEIIQKDGTTDSAPDICEAGDSWEKVLITWSSLGKKDKWTDEKDPAELLSTAEIYTATLDKKTGKLETGDGGETAIEQLTDDDIYDSDPKIEFDNFSGDVIVMYKKTQPDLGKQYDNYTEKLTDMISPYGNYNTIAYVLYDGEENKWLKDEYYDTEIASDEMKEEYVRDWKGQRFFDASIMDAEGAGATDPAVYDLTTGISGSDGRMIVAYTASSGADPTKFEDRELYVKLYDYDLHVFSEPVRLTNDKVSQTMPKLVTTGIDTYLFWYEDNKNMMYTDLTALFDKSEMDENGKFTEGNYINGAFADDYKLPVMRVSMESVTNEEAFGSLTSYDIYTDYDGTDRTDMTENMYIVWSKNVSFTEENEEGDTRESTALELYASAKITEKTGDADIAEDSGKNSSGATWSQPYKLTEDYKMNDGATATVDDNGNLILVHNQYTMTYRGDDEEFLSDPDNLRVVTKKNEDGEEQQFLEGEIYDISPVDLMVTRCVPCGSLDMADVSFSNPYPMAHDEIKVTAAIDNAGLKMAHGAEIEFYEYKDGKRGKLLHSVKSDKIVGVNEAYKVSFIWNMPDNTEDIEGLGFVAVIKEKDPEGGYFEETEKYSEPFRLQCALTTEIEYLEQNGDHFDMAYRVDNVGNKEVPEGTVLNLNLATLYGDAQEVYGVDNTILKSIDVSGIMPRTDYTQGDELEIPASVFSYCGYDAVYPEVLNAQGERMAIGDDMFATSTEPMSFTVNGGNDITLKVGDTAKPEIRYTNVDAGGREENIVYTVADTSVATVKDGVVTAVGAGETDLTVTLMPYGTEKTVRIKVTGAASHRGGGGGGGSASAPTPAPASTAEPAATEAPTSSVTPESGIFRDVPADAWYYAPIMTAYENGLMNGVSDDMFEPETAVTRGMFVTALYRAEGEPEVEATGVFEDVAEDSWYKNAVAWAYSNGIVNGIDDTHYAPEDVITREQMAAIVYRYAGYKGDDTAAAETEPGFADSGDISDYAYEAFRWSVANEIFTGFDDNTVRPAEKATRAQTAVILNKVYDRYTGAKTE